MRNLFSTPGFDAGKAYGNAINLNLVASNATLAARPRMRMRQTWLFPAETVRYCSASDVACSVCTRSNFWRSPDTIPDSRFCLGDDGACVCVDVCERRFYVHDECGNGSDAAALPTAHPSYFTHNVASDNIGATLYKGLLAMVALSVVVVVVLVRRRCAAERLFLGRQAAARRARLTARSRELGVNPLTLSGWESHRRDLIEKEIARYANDEDAGEGSRTTPATAYVSVDDSSNPASAQPPAATAVAATRGPTTYNQALPTPHQLAPLTATTPPYP